MGNRGTRFMIQYFVVKATDFGPDIPRTITPA